MDCNTKENGNLTGKAYIMKSSDCVFEGGVMVRVKRKYGKFDRPVMEINTMDNEELKLYDNEIH